jgi:dolichol-phosphate mannosyltransferase
VMVGYAACRRIACENLDEALREGIDLPREYRVRREDVGLGEKQVRRLRENGVKVAFLTEQQRAALWEVRRPRSRLPTKLARDQLWMWEPMKLSVLIPVFNEEDSVRQLLDRVLAVAVDKEIVVVDDCSTDHTWQVLNSIDDPRVRVFHHHVNQGKGSAVCSALQHATGDTVIIQDADLEYDPNDYPRLLQPVEKGEAQVVYGVRDLNSQKLRFRFGNKLLTWCTNVLYGSRIQDMETCYKLMPREVMLELDLQPSRFQIEPEITGKLLRRGHHIHEVPISYHPREEKKLSPWKDGLPALWTLLKYRFSGT